MKTLIPVVCDVVSPIERVNKSYTGIIICVVVLVVAIALIAMRVVIKKRKSDTVSEADISNIAVAKESEESDEKTE